MEIRDVETSDATALLLFRCSGGDVWARDVEAGIREDLPSALAKGQYRAMGAWINGDLAGVVAWRRYGVDDWWLLDLLASSLEHRGVGVAKALYRKLIERARNESVRLVFSRVDRQNYQMIGLQEHFRAVGEIDPNDVDYLLYVLDLDDGLAVQP